MGPASSVVIQLLLLTSTQAHQVPVSSFSSSLSAFPKPIKFPFLSTSEALDADIDGDRVDHEYSGPRTPSTISDNHLDVESDTRPQQYDTSDAYSEDEYEEPVGAPKRKKGGYDSRIEQILYENPDLPILIVDAGKSLESGGKYIVYTIRTGVRT
jgi:hypothetical protein